MEIQIEGKPVKELICPIHSNIMRLSSIEPAMNPEKLDGTFLGLCGCILRFSTEPVHLTEES